MKKIYFAFLLLVLPLASLRAQWQIVAPQLAPGGEYGALSYKAGTIWAGNSTLFFSPDSGRTWVPTTFPDPSGITDICFLNADTGVVSTLSGLYQTFDRGQTWSDVALYSWQWMRVAYNHSPSLIYAMAGSEFFHSSDGGKTWLHRAYSKYGLSFALDRYGGISFPDTHSSDFGKTWTSLGPFPPSSTDAWSIDVDSCDSRKMVVAVDNYYTSADGLCRIVTTRDGGNTWTVAKWWKKPNLAGALGVGPHTMFAGALDRIMRSTDAGTTWSDMASSPGVGPDTRSICAISDNLIFVLDANGSVWMTSNSGGDSIRESSYPPNMGIVTLSTHALFDGDSIPACNGSATSTIQLTASGCAPNLQSYEFTGIGTASYATSATVPGSLDVLFKPVSSGPQSAKLLLHYDDGSSDTVTLNGIGTAPNQVAGLREFTTVDTLGEVITVPIEFYNLPDSTLVECLVHFPPSFEYLGSWGSATGNPIDQAVDSTGIARIRFFSNNTTPPFAMFRVYSDSTGRATITFDSVQLLSIPNAACQYAVSDEVVIVQMPSGCGIEMISDYLQSDSVPRFSIYPNPATTVIHIVSSDEVPSARIELYDMLGTLRNELVQDLNASMPFTFDLPHEHGLYTMRIQAAGWTLLQRLIVQ